MVRPLWCIALIGVLAQSVPAAEPPALNWSTDFKQAQSQAKQSKKPILAFFTGSDWCGWCGKLKHEVFEQPEFKKWAAANFILLEIDFPRQKSQSPDLQKQNKQLADKYDIQGFPTVLFLDAVGNVKGTSGYIEGGPAKWIAQAERQIGARGKR
jgi:protein disulfide-isomerase